MQERKAKSKVYHFIILRGNERKKEVILRRTKSKEYWKTGDIAWKVQRPKSLGIIRDKKIRNELIREMRESTCASVRELSRDMWFSKDIIFRKCDS